MGKTSKLFLAVVAVLVLAIGGGLVYVYLTLDSIVARLIEEQGTRATDTPVRVAGVSVRLAEASGEIERLTVANPEGFDGMAFELENFAIRIDPSTITAETVVLEEVTVDGARLNILQQGRANNLRQLLKNLSESAAGGEPAPEESGRRLIIERFTLTGASAYVSAPDLGEAREVAIPDIVLTDVGKASGGATGSEIARQVLRPVIERALSSAAVQSFREKAKEKLEGAASGILEGLRDKLGGDEETED